MSEEWKTPLEDTAGIELTPRHPVRGALGHPRTQQTLERGRTLPHLEVKSEIWFTT